MESTYIYIYSWQPEEHALCQLEQRSFFGFDTQENILQSSSAVEPSRSPFIKGRLQVVMEAEDFQHVLQYAQTVTVPTSYKVVSLNTMDLANTQKIPKQERQQIERSIGMKINGEPSLEQPHIVYGILLYNGRWYFGYYVQGEAVWLSHQQKPQTYSTSLNTRVARAIVNIAVPSLEGVSMIDPCCGIGTVLVEALSMGIPIEGWDINPFACVGARKNIAYFGYEGTVTLGSITDIEGYYDAAIVDMPYNIFTHITEENRISIIRAARQIARRVVFVTTEPMDKHLQREGFRMKDGCIVKKRSFVRQVIVCE